jgi:hypothetical protein
MPHPPAGAHPTSCPHCGAPVSSPFCTSCGRALETRVQAPTHTPATTARGGRTLLLRALVAFVVLIATGFGGVLGYQWWRDRPATQALDEAAAAVSAVSDPLAKAATLDDVSAAASGAPAAAKTVADVLADLSDDESTLADRVRPVLQSQQAFLEAVAPFEGLGEESLAVWGSSFPAVQESLGGLATSRRSLSSYDDGAAGHVGDPRDAIDHTIDVVGSAATESLAARLDELLVDMEQVTTTREAAVLGERAAPLAESAEAAEAGQEGAGLASLVSLGDALGAIADLDGMDPETLLVWSGARARLSAATDQLGLSSAAATDSMSAWISQAQKKMDTWQAAYDQAESARSAATSHLDTYADSVRRTLRQYDRARDATSDALEEADLDDGSSYTVEYAMEEGVLTRRDLLDDLESLNVPGALVTVHGGLETVLDSAVEAMRTGEQAVEDWNLCYSDCAETFRDTSEWQSFSSRSGEITGEFDRALKAWNGALTQALNQANAVPLPPVPQV